MAKIRVYELAKELQVQPKELLELLTTIGVTGKVPSSSIEDTAARSLRQMIENKNNPQAASATEDAPSQNSAMTFQNFRSNTRRTGGDFSTEVSSDVIEDYREQVDLGDVVVQGPAKSGPGARRDAPRPAAPASPAPAPSAPVNRVAPASKGAPSAPAGSNGTPSGPSTGGPSNGAAGSAPAAGANGTGATPPPPAPTFGGRGGGRNDFRRGGNRGGRFGGRGGNRFEGRGRDFNFNAPEAEVQAVIDPADQKLTIPESITIAELAQKLNKPAAELIRKLFMMNIMRSANQAVGADVASQIAGQYGYTIEVATARSERHLEEEDADAVVPVPPVVTIMGHVDHGKTSLLDIIRSANVQTGEAGGITQRIGAYETEHNGETIVFLDTPGHAAFTRMRARGAHVTDIAVLVVAADDGVMPQTREAIDHARAAKVPIIIAMNKMDRAEADPDRVKGELAELELIPEDYGGDTVVIPVSAKTGQGVQELLDMLLLVAELQELKANPTGFATGTIIEANQDPQKGAVATVLVHKGTLRVGDYVVVGEVHGRVRAMFDYKGDNVEEAGPKKPVSVLGLSAVPNASDTLKAIGSSREARELAEQFRSDSLSAKHAGSAPTLQDLFAKIQKGAVKELNLIVKADGQGSIEAMVQSLQKLAHEEVRVKIIGRGVGQVSESDVMLAEASQAIIIAFSVGVDPAAASLADREKIEIRRYDVIYDAINEITAALEGMLAPVYEERLSGEADVRQIFSSTKAGTIAGCLVQSGKLIAGSTLRVWRKGNKIYDGKLDNLRHVKQDVKEQVAGQECGVSTDRFNDFQIGDILQSIIMEPVKRNIEDKKQARAVVGPPEVGGR
ncbi:MAG: translation initiation factor [Abditibacteriota bacterium]|nr:translation initiation factor [Abditibacteriota bacterium]